MNKSIGGRIRSIQIILWAALAAISFSTEFMQCRWQSPASWVIAFSLLCSYYYRKNPTAKRLKGSLIVLGVFCVGLILLCFLKEEG